MQRCKPIPLALAAALACGGAFAQSAPAAGGTQDLLSGARAGVMLRSSYFERTKPVDTDPHPEAWGLGGWLWGETGELNQMFSLGGAYYFVGKAYSPADGGGSFILDDQNSGYGVLGEAWGRLRFGDHALTVGRQALSYNWSLDGIYRTYNRYDGAFIGRRDVRAMVPLDFESATVNGKLAGGNVRYYGGYAWDMRQVNSPKFHDLAKAALLPGESDGMLYGGAQWKFSNDMMLQGAYHSVQDIMNMAWVDLDYVWRLGNDRYVRFDTQYIHQSDNGKSYLGNFSTWNWAGYLEARFVPWWIPYAAVGVNGSGDELRSPYSLGPSYLVQRVGENAKAGEKTLIIASTFDFSTLGVRGLSFDISYGWRRDRHAKGNSAQPLADWDELALDLIYALPKETGLPAGTRTRLRWAQVKEKGERFSGGTINRVNEKYHDIRFDIQIPFNF
jgi:hypothetical protein